MNSELDNRLDNESGDESDNLIQESNAEIDINAFTIDEDKIDMNQYKNDSFSKLSLEQQKKLLFKEHIRLKEFSKTLEDERNLIDIQKNMLQRQQSKNMILKKQLEGQESLFDQKWQLLEHEVRQLTIDKERFQREKLMYKDQVYREARRTMSNAENVKIFFKGVNDTESLKKRYKALLKIYHPDNSNGDDDLAIAIKTEYERLARFYLGT